MTIRPELQHRHEAVGRMRVILLLLPTLLLAACSGHGGKTRLPQDTTRVPLVVSEPASDHTDASSEGPSAVQTEGLADATLAGVSPKPVSPETVHPSNDADAEPSMVLKAFNSRDPYLPAQVDFINGLLRFAQTVTVFSEVEDGPLFDPLTQEIWMPGSFADVIESHFGEEEAPVADVYLHTLVHEVGHVLYDQYDLPLLAREEDAADALASVLLLEYAEDGARVVLNAARMFGLESETSAQPALIDFWSEHSLDIQRYYTALCHVYGSDPEGQARLVNEDYGLSRERAENCESEYKRIRYAWLKVLAPYLKR